MKKYTITAGLLLCCVMLLTCGKKKDDNLVGSTDHQVEAMRTSQPSILADGKSSLYITATVYDINGAKADSQKVMFETTHGTFETPFGKQQTYGITDYWGETRVELYSQASVEDIMAEVTATVMRTNVRTLPKATDETPLLVAVRIEGMNGEPRAFTPLRKTVTTAANSKSIQVLFLGVTVSAEIEETAIPADGLTQTKAFIKLRQTSNQKGISSDEVYISLKEGKVQSTAYTNYRGDAEVYITAADTALTDTLKVEYGNTLQTSTTVQYVWPILKLSTEETQIPADGKSKIALTAKLVSHVNTPIAGATIKFTADAGIITGLATTDKYGIATSELVAGTEPVSAVKVIARFLELSDTVSVAFGSQALNRIEFTDMTTEPLLRDGVDSRTLAVNAFNELDQPVPNAVIRLSANYGAVPDSVVTDQNGHAEVEFVADNGQSSLLTTNAFNDVKPKAKSIKKRAAKTAAKMSSFDSAIESIQAQSQDVTATILATKGSIQATHTVDLKGIKFALSATPDSINADGVASTYIKAIVKETTSNLAVVDHAIGFASDLGTIPTFAYTNDFGVAMISFVSATQPGTATITATCGTIEETVPVYMLGSLPKKIWFISENEDPLLRNGSDFTLVSIAVVNDLNQSAPDVIVNLSATYGSVPKTVWTNSDGQASFAYTTDSGESDGSTVITASWGNIQSSITIPLLGIQVSASADPDSILADGVSNSTIRIEVKQTTSHMAIGGQWISLSTASGTIAPSTSTDAQGVAYAQYTSGTTPGLASVTVAVGTLERSVNLYLLNQQPASITFDPDSEPVLRDGLSTKDVSLTVLDELDQPVANFPIHLSTSAGSVPTQVITDNDGRATFQFRTDAGTLDADATITASNGTLQNTFTISLMGLVVDITPVPDTLAADGESTSEIRVEVKQLSTSLAVTNYPIRFAATLGTITPTSTTDDLGVATATYSAGVTPGISVMTVIVGKLVLTKNIFLVSDDPNDVVLTVQSNYIYVKETGNVEQTQIYATVLGISGQPLESEVGVTFEIIRGPGGGEYLEPNDGSATVSSVIKTVNGKATVAMRAGTRAGTVQIRASLVDYPDVAAQHTSIVIRSGPPYMWIDPSDPNNVITHTTLMINPGQANVGFVNPLQEVGISVLFGDKYNNPIEPGTAVYFTTTGGIISTDAITNVQGRAGVTLQNGYPFPFLYSNDPNQLAAKTIPNPNDENDVIDITIPDYEGGVINNTAGNQGENDGVAVVVAYAWGKDQDGTDVKVWATNTVVFSRAIQEFSAEPDRLLIDPGQVANIYIRLYDIYGNPVAAGSSLTASTNKGELTRTELMPEAGSYGRGTTYFSTGLINTYSAADSVVEVANVKITLSSPNGSGVISVDPITLRALP
ncbi:Ig-like domain-containing protein [candidate division KSB1 bacterium]|nr:Ig-like domain-containing protein [candidate division KSB1 bacterium]